jgi:hypothetical protein
MTDTPTHDFELPSELVVTARKHKTSDLDVFSNRKLMRQSARTGEAHLAKQLTVATVHRGPYSFTSNIPPYGGDVLYGDLYALLFNNRLHFKGPIYEFDVQCPAIVCRQPIEWEVDLNDFETKPLSAESREIFTNGNRFTKRLDLCGLSVEFNLLTGTVHQRQRQYMKKYGDSVRNIYAARLCGIEGIERPSPKQYVEFVGELDTDDYDTLVFACEDADCGIDTSFEIQCPHCERIFWQELEIGFDFFSRSLSRRRRADSDGGSISTDSTGTKSQTTSESDRSS